MRFYRNLLRTWLIIYYIVGENVCHCSDGFSNHHTGNTTIMAGCVNCATYYWLTRVIQYFMTRRSNKRRNLYNRQCYGVFWDWYKYIWLESANVLIYVFVYKKVQYFSYCSSKVNCIMTWCVLVVPTCI